MRSYLIEDLTPENMDLVAKTLKEKGLAGSLEGIYYLPIPAELLNDEQQAHQDECGPHIFALETLDDAGSLKLELLVRARGKLRCSCVSYANPAQTEYITQHLDTFLRDLDISV
jgi:hypothetical protein